MLMATTATGRASVGTAAAFLAVCACTSAPVTGDDGGTPTCFVAEESSFNGFHGWSSAPATNDAGVTDGVHGLGSMTVYWNEAPPHGAAAFPVGTLIVKETEESDPTKRTVFAMSKHGCGYNAPSGTSPGADGWEWVSLANNADGSVTLLWSGTVAPAGQTYAGMPVGDCNGCHAGAASNDHVWDSALQLSRF
jgi:hypothetical protein